MTHLERKVGTSSSNVTLTACRLEYVRSNNSKVRLRSAASHLTCGPPTGKNELNILHRRLTAGRNRGGKSAIATGYRAGRHALAGTARIAARDTSSQVTFVVVIAPPPKVA